MAINPYASPQAGGAESAVRIRSVARAFKILGWFGVVLYTPIVIACISSLLLRLAGYGADSPMVLAGAAAFNGFVLGLAVLYAMTGRRIAKHDFTARRRAMFLSCLMMIGFPLFTIVGILCYRNIRLYFHADPAANPRSIDIAGAERNSSRRGAGMLSGRTG
jgi:hypothetical protein